MFCIVLYASKNVNCYFADFIPVYFFVLLNQTSVSFNFHVVKKLFSKFSCKLC